MAAKSSVYKKQRAAMLPTDSTLCSKSAIASVPPLALIGSVKRTNSTLERISAFGRLTVVASDHMPVNPGATDLKDEARIVSARD